MPRRLVLRRSLLSSSTLQAHRAHLIVGRQIYADVHAKGSALLDAALSALLPGSVALTSNSSSLFDLGSSLVAVDTLGLGTRRELVRVPLAAARALDDAAVQRSADGEAYILFESSRAGDTILEKPVGTDEVMRRANELTSRGTISPVTLRRSPSLTPGEYSLVAARALGDDFVLATPKLQVTVTKEGRISSIFDKELERELILDGKTAGFVVFQDHPLNWDAWCVPLSHVVPPLCDADQIYALCRDVGMSTCAVVISPRRAHARICLQTRSTSRRRRRSTPRPSRSSRTARSGARSSRFTTTARLSSRRAWRSFQ